MSRKDEIEFGDWVVKTCLLFGTSPLTAYKIATIVLKALHDELWKEEPKDGQKEPAR